MSINSDAASQLDADTKKLHELGYAQELRRRMSGFSNFAVSFTIISILSGCLTAYGIAMSNGGPVDMTWGWLLVGLMTTMVGLGMAEVCSAYPTAGRPLLLVGPAGQAQRGGMELVRGWFNLLGQVAVTAGIDYGFSALLQRLPEPDHRDGRPPRGTRCSSTRASSSSTPR